ncbi:MAG: tail fiber domain-containing protein [Planctomycetota bacterium]
MDTGFRLVDAYHNKFPFTIENNAPNGSLFVGANGNVGMGGGQLPDVNSKLDIRSDFNNGLLAKRSSANAHYLRVENTNSIFRCGVQSSGDAQFGALTSGKGLNMLAGGTTKVVINASGQISFGNSPPAITTHALVHESGANLTSGGVWTSVSSRAAKQDIEPITSAEARDAVRALQPVGYRYKNELDERYVGFIAEDVPELVATNDRKGLAPMDITAVLTKVVQDQDTLLQSQDRQLSDQQAEIGKQRELIARQEKLNGEQQETLATLMRRLADLEQKLEGR